MKPTFKLLLLFLILNQGLLSTSFGASYYFSTTSGDDSRTSAQAQNPNTPWKTIDKLNSILRSLQAGDVIYFQRGEEFFGTINLHSSGSPSNLIKFSAYGNGAAPIITSLVRVQGWRSLGNGVYESNQSFDMNELELMLIDGRQQERGRYPNRDQFNGGYFTISSSNGNSSVTSTQLSGAPNFNGAEIVIRKNQWIIDRHAVSSHSGNTVSFAGTGSYSTSTSFGFFIQNHINTLDRFGEWFFNRTNKKLYVYFGSNHPNNLNIQIPTRDNLFIKNYGTSNFQIDNLHFKGANKDAISIAGGRNVTLLNNTIEFSGVNGILSLTVLDLKVNGNTINNSNNNGIFLRYGNNGAHIVNNKIINSATFQGAMSNGDGAGIGIYAPSANSKVEYNEVINTGYSGIYFGGNSTEVTHNFIDNFCLNKGDGGGIYSYGAFSASRGNESKVLNNIIINGDGGLAGVNSSQVKLVGQAHGIFLDDDVSNSIVMNNTIANMHDSGVKIANVNNLRIENNTIYDSDKALAIGNSNTGGDVRNLTIQNNIIFPKRIDQLAYNFLSHKDDIAQIGTLNQNYFFKPFGDPFHIFVRFNNGSSVERIHDLERWRKAYNKDQTSKETQVSFEKFKVNNSIGDNLFKNGNFTSNVVGVFCGGCQSSWVKGLLSPGSLRVHSPGASTVGIPIGTVKKDANYVAKIRARSSKNGTIRIFLRHAGSPWQVVSPSTAIQLNSNTQEYSVLLRPYGNIENATILIVTDETDFSYWLEDLDIRESNIIETRPEDRILFEYNKSKSEKRISLDGSYIDGRGQVFSGSVSIPPYRSIVLFRTSSDIPRESVSSPTIAITSPTSDISLENGKSLPINTSVNANGNKIKEVVFYNGDKIIGRTSNAPYSFQWNNPQPGELQLKASINLESDISYDSDIITVNLSIVEDSEPETPNNSTGNPSSPVGGNPSSPVDGNTGSVGTGDNGQNQRTDAIYINAGSTRTVDYKGIEFISEFSGRFFNGGSIQAYRDASTEPMMQSQRFAKYLRYDIPVPNGTYQVKTYHNEAYFGVAVPNSGPNLRVFNISVEGKLVKKDFDVKVEFPDGDGELNFNNIVVNDGILSIELDAVIGTAAISGIAVIPTINQIQQPPLDVKPDTNNAPETTSAIKYQINTGSTRDATYRGSTFESEFRQRFFQNGNIEANTNASTEPMLQSQRFGRALRFRVPIENGTYTVITYHNEVYFGKTAGVNGPNLRVFDIFLQGQAVKTNMDLFAESNGLAVELTFNDVVVTNGILSLDLTSRVGDAAISGFSILSNTRDSNLVSKQLEGKFPDNGIFINTGNTRNTTYLGTEFVSEFRNRVFQGGNIEQNMSASPHELLRSQRFGKLLKYNIPVPNGSYTVVSYHNEVFFGNGNAPNRPGLRVFNISIEGRNVKSNVDMYLENNGGPIEFIYENIIVNDGILNVDLTSVVGDAAISGLAIFPSSSSNSQYYSNFRQTGVAENLESIMTFDIPSNANRIALYPNPARDEINIKIGRESDGATLFIHNSMGQTMLTQEISQEISNYGDLKIQLQGFSPGIYFISIHDLNGRFEKEKFIIK